MEKITMAEKPKLATNPENYQHRGMLITGLIIAMLFAALDGTVVGTAMPRIVGELGGLSLMTWLTTAYMLTSTTVVPIAGKLADLLGRKVVYITGIIIFMLGSALCGTAESMIQLIVYRGVQGIGGGVMMPMAMIIIGDLFAGKERAKWQGIFGGLYGLASVIGPQIGGWIVETLNWKWVFYINLPVGILAMIFISLGLKKHQVTRMVKIDIAGISTMTIGIVSLMLALTLGGKEYAWSSWQIISLFGCAFVFLLLFMKVEATAAEPILPLHLFKNRIFTLLNGVGFLMSIGMFGAILFVPLFMQGIVGVSPSQSGTIMTPMMITVIAGSILGGRIVYKIGVKTQIIFGMIVIATGFILLTTMGADTSKLTATLYMATIGSGMGLVMPILTLALQESFPKSELGVVTSSSQFFRSIGGTFGMTLLGTVMNYKSEQLLTAHLIPALQILPDPAKEMVAQWMTILHKHPEELYATLLNPAALASMPLSVKELLVPILKNSLIHSLHSVFWVGFLFVILGVGLALTLPKIKLTERKSEKR
jgi:EmrB/QacA subfamily drug resistance transporter